MHTTDEADFVAQDLGRVLAYIELTVNRRLSGLLRGSFLSAFNGPGSQPDTAREYEIGDDVRRMDWAVTARTGVAHVRTEEAERELECWIVAEPAARLSTGVSDTTKRHLLLAAAGAIAMLNDAPGSRTGLIAGPVSFAAGSGRTHSLGLLRSLASAHAESTLASDIDVAMTRSPRAGLIVVISDFLGPLDWITPLKVASARSEVLAIRLVDPADEALPGQGPVLLADSATGRTVELTINDKTREEYAKQAAAHHSEVVENLRALHARIITLRTDGDWVLDFARQLEAPER
nr:DUF58 domain-containing protein [Corynebacterium lactis]